jgi:hypothetical protein
MVQSPVCWRYEEAPSNAENQRRNARNDGEPRRRPTEAAFLPSSVLNPGPPPPSGRGSKRDIPTAAKAGDMTRFWLGRSVAWRLREDYRHRMRHGWRTKE